MKKYLCCFKGESSTSHENNDFLNYVRRHNIQLPDDRYPQDSSLNRHRLSHPVFSGVTIPWQEIIDGTQNRRKTNYLSRGNFGEVYRCDFPKCNKVGAAKFQEANNASSHEEFIAEITALQRAKHENVIKLLGKSFGRDQVALVYEFMPNGSLDHHLLGWLHETRRPGPGLPQNHPVLEWDMRMKIAVGVAQGLVYLHTDLKMVHRDVKAGNVLLDQDLVPKLTDFGLAVDIVADEDGSEIHREIYRVKGTKAYMAPEVKESRIVSTKSDVYSYGVFLLQLFTGRKAFDTNKPLAKRKLTDELRQVWNREEYIPLVVDVSLGHRFSVEGIVAIFKVVRMCTKPQPSARPDMVQVETLVRDAASHEIPDHRTPLTWRLSI